MNVRSLWVFAVLVIQAPLWSGCTVALWDKSTLAHFYQPADPANLHLFYSNERRDLLVQYDESRERDKKTRRRCYWLDPNAAQINHGQKPQFIASAPPKGLIPVPQSEIRPDSPPPGLNGLYAVFPPHEAHFTLYSGTNQIDTYNLPAYSGDPQTATKVLLTPLAMAGDATLVGAVVGLIWVQSSDPDLGAAGSSRSTHKPRNSGAR
jgi:hypothetical protein